LTAGFFVFHENDIRIGAEPFKAPGFVPYGKSDGIDITDGGLFPRVKPFADYPPSGYIFRGEADSFQQAPLDVILGKPEIQGEIT
jgi:hypothetical protein